MFEGKWTSRVGHPEGEPHHQLLQNTCLLAMRVVSKSWLKCSATVKIILPKTLRTSRLQNCVTIWPARLLNVEQLDSTSIVFCLVLSCFASA